MTSGHFMERGDPMNDGILKKKELKMTKLYDAAYELFTSKGVHETVIDEIVRRAGVAKGTFYLYFKDKYDLVDRLIVRKTSHVLGDAMEALAATKETSRLDFQQSVVFFVDYLVNFFRGNTPFLELIFRNFSLSLCDRMFHCTEMQNAREAFTANFMLNGGTSENAGKHLYLIVCMVSVVCYNSIVMKIPYEFEEIKPELYRSVQRILT
jgi:AcrR family transcriptional regulator